MGRNKAFIELGGETLVARAIRKARCVADEVFISANETAPFEPYGLPIVRDLQPGSGPLGGLHAALRYTRRDLVLLLACDLPFLTASLLETLIAASRDVDAVLPVTADGRAHPLCAVYRKSSLPAVEDGLRKGRYKMIEALCFHSLKTKFLTPEEAGFSERELLNVNTPQELALLSSELILPPNI
jgi:molybdopterin-guanine dinucleotide biosynthesis protein A